jgi:hypothetical protein
VILLIFGGLLGWATCWGGPHAGVGHMLVKHVKEEREDGITVCNSADDWQGASR